MNSFSNSKDLNHQAECGTQPDFGGLPEAHSPLAFLRELSAVKQRNPWAAQFPVDLGRKAVLRAESGCDGDWVISKHKDQVASG